MRAPVSLTVVAAICSGVLACSDGSKLPSSDGAADLARDNAAIQPDSNTGDVPSSGADAERDGKGRTVTGAECHDVSFGKPVAVTPLTMVPTFTGGTITDGTFDAIAEETTVNILDRRAWTLKFEGKNYYWVSFNEASSNRDDFEHRTRGTFSVSGNTLSLAENCRSTVVLTHLFTASGDDLLLDRFGAVIRMRRR
jgi:hypothetical protein